MHMRKDRLAYSDEAISSLIIKEKMENVLQKGKKGERGGGKGEEKWEGRK